MKQLKISFIFFVAVSLFSGMVYTVMMTLAAQIAFPEIATGSLVIVDGRIVDSTLVNKKPIDRVAKQADIVRKGNGITVDAEVPAELALSSASGLDPHISLQGALLQAPRVARARGVDTPFITGLVEKCAGKRYFGLFGDSSVTVLEINLILDAMGSGG